MTASLDEMERMWRELVRRSDETNSRLCQPGNGAPGCSPKEPVWKKDKVVLYRYLPVPAVRPARLRPLLICYALVNRPEVLDLEEGRSLIQRLLAAGLEVYLIDWGRADESDRGLELADYIERYLDGAAQYLSRSRRTSGLNLLGVCQGGTFSLCYSALHPRRVANLVTMVTPVDFHTPADLLSKWARRLDMESIRRAGNLPGVGLTALFLSLRPFRLMHQKYVALLDQAHDASALDTFRRMESWIFDSPDQAAAAAAQFVRWFYQENRLARGTLEIGGQRVDLRKIRQPVLNIYAEQDHIVPPAASRALREHIGSSDYTELCVDTGHIGMYVSRQSQLSVSGRIAGWLREHR